MVVRIVWKTGNLENIDSIDFEGPKLYMFVLKMSETIHHIICIGITRQKLRERVFERFKFGEAFANLLDGELLISCGKVFENDSLADEKLINSIESVLINELGTEQEQSANGCKYVEIKSVGDISDIHDFHLFWKEELKSDKYFGLRDFKAKKYILNR